ncbi:drug resistance transporter, EmrB/QacA subfamily [Nocardioides scoriae]|uniref:Drug resistance transporter, EmrB/QacA subfamily n=1 Tax=Nocardioides scoriae TaxID=642780 RepID=A0A1H1LAH6_9ACTN|nr:MFS transporter [Nocardioides scoriae]SDR71584.1 drug resistance transporter, EmrB/QacA subfamily [Nocardioides scoriae]
MTTTQTPPVLDPTDVPEPLPRRAWAGLAVLLTAMILNILDSTIVNVAAPTIQADLAMTPSALEWVAAAYTLALAVGIMAGARLGDVVGRRRMLVLGLVGFAATSLACSLAWDGTWLVVARALQGLAAAVMVPQTFGLLRDVFPPRHLGKAFAAFGPVIGLSTVLGPVVAGLLLRADLLGSSWRALFWLNLPLCAAALLAAHRVLPAGAPRRHGLRLDWGGTLLLGLASFLLVFPLVDGRALGWPTWVLGVLVASAPVLAVFVVHQRRRGRAGRTTLIEASVLTKRSYVSGVAFTMFFFGSIVGVSLTVGLFLQLGLGFGPMHAALYLAALAVGAFVGSGVGAWAATAVGRPILHVGLVLMMLGTAVLWLSLRAVEATETVGLARLAPGLFVFGLGMGMIFVPLFSIIMGEVDDREVGSASGLLESVQQLGASLGVAVLGTLFFGRLGLEEVGPVAAVRAGRHLEALEVTLLATLGVLGLAWCLGWLLPRRARADH